MPRQLDPTKRKFTGVLCKSSKPRTNEKGGLRTIKYSDAYGLNLEVRHDGKFWFYAFRLNGKQLKLSLGSYPTVRLSDARDMHAKSLDAGLEGDWIHMGKVGSITDIKPLN